MRGGLDRNGRLAVFERMLLMRRFEEAVAGLAADKMFAAHYHLYIGQEATGAAALEAVGPDDFMATTHRNHGHVIGRGADPGRALAEILGRADGLNGGRGGTLHLSDRSLGILSTSAVVGSCIGLATGAGLRAKQAGAGAVSVAFFGDGALEEGIAFESMNIAALWQLPVLYLCENNSPGAGGAAAGEYPASVIAARSLGDIPAAVGVPAESVDGADADAVYAVVAEALARIRGGGGPAFIEAVTTRWPGSRPLWPELKTGITELAAAWDETLITGEHARWIREHDPVLRFARTLAGQDALTREAAGAIDTRIAERIEAARAFALASPMPPPESALDGVFG